MDRYSKIFSEKFNNKVQRKSAFTMVDVLLTLMIIGVIAVITIPVLAQSVIERNLVSRLMKMQNILSTAFRQNFQITDKKITDYGSTEEVIRKLEDGFIGVSHNCVNDTCLNDGSEISYSDYSASCNLSAPGSASALKNSCMSIVVDLNGVKKKPNKPGKDRFRFWATREGIYPEGDINFCSNGYDCTATVILFGKLYDYEKEKELNQNNNNPCSDGYVKINGECVSMESSNCLEAENSECTACNDGYTLNDNGVCEAAQVANCASYSGSKCVSCISGYHLASGNCYANTTGCSQYSSSNGSCTGCSNNYRMINGSCYMIINGCANQSYINPNTCMQCSENYVLNSSGTCSSMPGCIAGSNGQCTACSSKYTLQSGHCVCKGWVINGGCY